MLEKYRPLFEAPEANPSPGESAPILAVDAPALESGNAAPETAEANADPAAEPPPPEPVREQAKPWYLKRISEESQKAADTATRLAAAERRAAEAEALAARLQTGNEPATRDHPSSANANDMDARVRAEAARQRFIEDTHEVRARGMAELGSKFSDALGVLNAAGATSDDFVADVFAVDKANAHGLLTAIAADPEKAVTLAGMNSRQRIVELTRMSIAAASPAQSALSPPREAPRTVSKAPAPAPRIDPGATKAVHAYDDSVSDDEFTANWKANLAKRTARR